MLKFTHRLLLIIAAGSLLLACSALNLNAQVDPGGARRPTPTPTPSPTPTPQPPSGGGGRVIGGKSRISDRARNLAEALIPSNSIRGTIRWKKEYGMVPTGAGTNTASPIPCGQYFVAALKTVNDGGSFGRLTVVNFTPNLPNKIVSVTEAGDYYVCSYNIPDLPTNTKLLIMAGMGGILLLPELDPYPLYHTLPWIGGSQPQPPPGYDRVFTGGKSVTLTDSDSRAVVNFEMVYKPLPTPPR